MKSDMHWTQFSFLKDHSTLLLRTRVWVTSWTFKTRHPKQITLWYNDTHVHEAWYDDLPQNNLFYASTGAKSNDLYFTVISYSSLPYTANRKQL